MTSAPNIDHVAQTKALPSIKDTLLKPRNLLFSLIFSFVINFVLLVALILVDSNSGSSPQTSTPTTAARPSATPQVTTRPTVKPSFTPDESLIEFQNCFHNCDVEELLANTRSKALTYSNFKAQIYHQDDQRRTCYGNYLESSSNFRELNSYQHIQCPSGYLSRPLQTSIQISDNIYYLNSSGNWNLDSKPRVSQTKLLRILDGAIAQQDKFIETIEGKGLKQITSTSKTVNDLNQLVTKTNRLVVNEYLDVLSYESEETNIFKESGYFFGLGIENVVEAPL